VVEIDGIPAVDAIRVRLPCSEIDAVAHREGDDPSGVRKQPGRTKYDNVTIERGLTGSTDFWEWVSQTSTGTSKDRNVVVTLLDEARNQVWRWTFRSAFPVAYCFSPLDAASDAVLVETLVLAFDTMAIE
jgi:phage tail-like protein